MLKTLSLLLLFASLAFAQSYKFSELKYIDAIGRYSQRDGVITFTKDGLDIKYPKSKNEFYYDGSKIKYLQNHKEQTLTEKQANNMMFYFNILKMLHKGDNTELKKHFTVTQKDKALTLTPTDFLKYYIKKIVKTKGAKNLQDVKIFFNNGDSIVISIHNEIY